MKSLVSLKLLLNQAQEKYHNWGFVKSDPLQIPHLFQKKQDIEISAFIACLFALGNRKIIIQKTLALLALMNNQPYDFMVHFKQNELAPFYNFAHRFFKYEDLVFIFNFLQKHYQKNDSLEKAFISNYTNYHLPIENALIHFQQYIFQTPHTTRSEKHISTPLKFSACKRLNLFLRWMVRKDNQGIDFGMWNFISPTDLVIPVDTHVLKVCRDQLKITQSKVADWKTALEITHFLKKIDSQDPVKYDFALMGIGLNSK